MVSDDYIGNVNLLLTEMKPLEPAEQWFTVCAPRSEDGIPKRLGKSLKRQGYQPRYPIALVPGFMSTALDCELGDSGWKGQRVWVNLGKLMGQTGAAKTLKNLFSKDHSKDSIEGTKYKNKWIKHMVLQEDGYSDPIGISLRPVEGYKGVSYLSEGLFESYSYVMGPLIDNLRDLGYGEHNLTAYGYDWRIPPAKLEERDGYFTKLKTGIENARIKNGLPVVIVAHSMGNRTTQYFLNWVEQREGRAWIEENVHAMFAVGAPWLGAPKSLRGLISGDRMGLDTFLKESDGITFARTLGSTPFLFPVGHNRYFPSNDSSFVFAKDSNDTFSSMAMDECKIVQIN